MTDVCRFMEAAGGLITHAEEIAKDPDAGEEEHAFLDLLEPTSDLVHLVPEWLNLADEGEGAWCAPSSLYVSGGRGLDPNRRRAEAATHCASRRAASLTLNRSTLKRLAVSRRSSGWTTGTIPEYPDRNR